MNDVGALQPVPRFLLTPDEAAQALGISRSLLYELLRSGRLESVRIGSCRRVPLSALSDFVDRLRLGELVDRDPGCSQTRGPRLWERPVAEVVRPVDG
jgi:excisionase family DNA binding protein